jgi:hypothetical protein
MDKNIPEVPVGSSYRFCPSVKNGRLKKTEYDKIKTKSYSRHKSPTIIQKVRAKFN